MDVCSVVFWFDGSGCCCCWFTRSICLETDVVAFSGVSCNSPPKCFSRECRVKGESQVGRSVNLGSSGSTGASATAEVCSS